MILGFDMKYCVYKHTTPNNKIYIGITSKSPEKRWKNGYGYSGNIHFTNAIKKYGWANIKHEILYQNVTKNEAEKIEIELIKQYKSNDVMFGYNLAAGGKTCNGYKHSEEEKQKIAGSLMGKKHSKERKQHESEARKKLWENPEYRQRLKASHIGKMLGKNSPRSKSVIQYDIQGNEIFIYDCISDAERKTGIDHRAICACLSGKQKQTHGYIWKAC